MNLQHDDMNFRAHVSFPLPTKWHPDAPFGMWQTYGLDPYMTVGSVLFHAECARSCLSSQQAVGCMLLHFINSTQ